MAQQSFKCPNCGAPLDYSGKGETTMRCPYCETSVIVPEEVRGADRSAETSIGFDPANYDTTPIRRVTINQVTRSTAQGRKASRNLGCTLGIIIAAIVVLIVVVSVGVPLFAAKESLDLANLASHSLQTQLVESFPTEVETMTQPTKVAEPTLTPTPGFALEKSKFGKKGIGNGMFNDARWIAVDGNGVLYVADYQGGRVQALDQTGKFLRSWKVGKANNGIVLGLAANLDGTVFASSSDGAVYTFNGSTGKQTARWTHPEGGEFGSLAITPDGNLAAVWYQGRNGLITSLGGHREDLIVYSPDGKPFATYKSFISAQTENPALDVYLAVDGEGYYYALSSMDSLIFKYSPTGKYMNNFPPGLKEGQSYSGTAIAVDGQGRIYVGGPDGIAVMSSSGSAITSFPSTTYPDSLIFDQDNHLWGVARESVTEYILTGE